MPRCRRGRGRVWVDDLESRLLLRGGLDDERVVKKDEEKRVIVGRGLLRELFVFPFSRRCLVRTLHRELFLLVLLSRRIWVAGGSRRLDHGHACVYMYLSVPRSTFPPLVMGKRKRSPIRGKKGKSGVFSRSSVAHGSRKKRDTRLRFSCRETTVCERSSLSSSPSAIVLRPPIM